MKAANSRRNRLNRNDLGQKQVSRSTGELSAFVRFLSAIACRKPQAKGGALQRLRFDFKRRLVVIEHDRHKGKTKPHAGGVTLVQSIVPLGAEMGLSATQADFFRHSNAVVAHFKDRGAGFDRAAVAPDRRGIAESIEGRVERAGGTAAIVTAPGSGTEVELRLPRSDS